MAALGERKAGTSPNSPFEEENELVDGMELRVALRSWTLTEALALRTSSTPVATLTIAPNLLRSVLLHFETKQGLLICDTMHDLTRVNTMK